MPLLAYTFPLIIFAVTVKLLNVPTLVIFGCALVVTVAAVPEVATFKLATCVVLVTVNGAVPVAILDINLVPVIVLLTASVPGTAIAPVIFSKVNPEFPPNKPASLN